VTDSQPADVHQGQTARKLPKDADPRNRRTQDWKFPTPEEFEAVAPRPRLPQSKTMPVPRFAGYTISTSSSPDRASLIDLDSALHIEIPDMVRPTTADSIANSSVTEVTSGDPFDLEPQMHLSEPSNRGSLHMKSQSEPTAGFQSSKQQTEDDGDSLTDGSSGHNRSSSMNRSELDRSSVLSRNSNNPHYDNADAHWSSKTLGYNDRSNTNSATWDLFTEDEELQRMQRDSSERNGPRHARRIKSSTGSARTVGSDEGGMGATLRPPRTVVSGNLLPLRPPREPHKVVLLPEADPGARAQVLSMMFEDMAYQADYMYQLFSRYLVDDDVNDAGGVQEGHSIVDTS